MCNSGLEERTKIPEQKEELYRQSHAQLNTLFENCEDYIMIADAKGVPQLFNSAYAEIIREALGIEMKPGIKPHKFLDDPKAVAFWDNLHERVLVGEKYRVEYSLNFSKDNVRYFEFSFNPIIEEGKVNGFIEITRDITGRKQIEEVLKKAKNEFKYLVKERTADLTKANEKLKREIKKRKKTELAILESEKRYRILIETMTDALGIINEKGVIEYLNDKGLKLIGYSPEELIGRSPMELLDKANQKIFKENLEKRTQGVRDSYELTWTRKDGKKIHTIVSPRDIYDENGDYKGTFAVITDITSRKEMEEVLRQSEEKYRSVVESTEDSIYMVNQNGRYLFMNKKYQLLHGITEGTYKNKKYSEIHSKKTTEILKNQIKKVFETGKPLVYEDKNEKGDRYLIQSMSPVKGPDSKTTAVTVISKDITERVLAEQKFLKEKELCENLINSSIDGILGFDKNFCHTIWNPGMEGITGVKRDQALGVCAFDLFPFLKAIGEDHFLNEIFSGKSILAKDRPFTIPQTKKQGFYEGHYSPIRNEQNEIIGGLAIIRDVTERKIAEDKLKERQKDLENKKKSLEDLNSALEVLLNKRNEESKNFEENVLFNVKQLIKPVLEKIKNGSLNTNQKLLFDILESNINEIISPFLRSFSSISMNFTPSEIRIASYLRQGKTTKEIAVLENLSTKTIATHRRNIRKKLGLTKRKINLKSYLLTLP